MNYGNSNSGILFIKYEPNADELRTGTLFPPPEQHWKTSECDVMVGEFRRINLSPSSIHFSTLWDEVPKKPKTTGMDRNEKQALVALYNRKLEDKRKDVVDLMKEKKLTVLVGQKMVDFIYGKGTYSTPWGLQIGHEPVIFGFPLFSSGFGTIGEIRLSLEKIKSYINKKELV